MKKLMFVCLIALLISAGMPLAQNVTTWSATVKNVEALLQQYIQKSDELLRKEDSLYASINQNPLSYAGTACANCYWPAHQCAILGRMLGRTELIAHLEAPLPSLSSSLREVWSDLGYGIGLRERTDCCQTDGYTDSELGQTHDNHFADHTKPIASSF